MKMICVFLLLIAVPRLAAAGLGGVTRDGGTIDAPAVVGGGPPAADRKAPLPKFLKVNFYPFSSETITAITPENIETAALLLPHLGEREYRLMMRSLAREMMGLKKGAYRFTPIATRLRVERDGEVILVDAEGVVKTRTREYMLEPRAFLSLSELLMHVGSKTTKPGDKETKVEANLTLFGTTPRK